jgi:hypothetical protein
MKLFEFRVTQPAATFYKGTLIIEASSKTSAISRLKRMGNDDIETLCFDWEIADECFPDGNVEIWNNEKLI